MLGLTDILTLPYSLETLCQPFFFPEEFGGSWFRLELQAEFSNTQPLTTQLSLLNLQKGIISHPHSPQLP